VQQTGKRFYCLFIALLIISAVLALVSIPLLEGTNTGQDLCVYTTEINANWHFMGEPCKLTSNGIHVLVFGYSMSFIFIFVISWIIGKCFFQLQTYCKQKI
jgi:hypothetical protein